ncbi:MAG TPA: ribosome maturation factor RimP [Elusimicrobia bacterium]|nr:ribosome maturation factor RimP [Elusimicrobiota bacterium]
MNMDAKEIETLLTPLLEQEGAELVDMNWRREGHRWVLRLFLDKGGGITLDDCAYLSERVGAFIDEKGSIEQSYVLEVSSPGLDRVIKKEGDFERFSGKPVKIRLKLAENGQRKFSGTLRGLAEGKVAVQIGKILKQFDRRNIDELRLDDSAAIDLGEE